MIEIAGRKVWLKWLSGSLLLFFFVFGFTPQASAEKGDGSMELMLGFGFGPDDPDFEFDSVFGPGIGLGYEISEQAQLRADVSYFKWDDTGTVSIPLVGTFNRSSELRNIPIFVGGRFLSPLTDYIRLFAELGLSVNFLKVEQTDPALGTDSESETKLGLVPGLGIEFRLAQKVSLGANVRYNLITKGVGDFDEAGTSFLSAAALVGYHF